MGVDKQMLTNFVVVQVDIDTTGLGIVCPALYRQIVMRATRSTALQRVPNQTLMDRRKAFE